MSTGDLRNNLYKLQSKLKKIEFHGYLNCISLGKGDPESFLPLFHYILLDAFPLLADYFASKGYNLYGKKDTRFIECVYKLLRDEFTYKPAITKEQFFSLGFSERKIILTCDIIDMCQELNKKLIRVEYNKSYATRKNQNNNVKRRSKTKLNNPVSYYDYDEKENFHNPINISNHSKNEYYMDDELFDNQERIYQNELDGVIQYPPSRFLKPAWNEEERNSKVKESSQALDEQNYYEESYNEDYNNTEPIHKYNKEPEYKQTHQDYHYSNDNERNEISNMNNNEIMSYIKLLLESNNEIKELIKSLTDRITKLELKVENSSTFVKSPSQTENNIMKIKNIIEKEKNMTKNNNINNDTDNNEIPSKYDDEISLNSEISLIQEQCVAEEVSIDESVSSRPSISVQRSSYSQNRYNKHDSLELFNSNMKTRSNGFSSNSEIKYSSSQDFNNNSNTNSISNSNINSNSYSNTNSNTDNNNNNNNINNNNNNININSNNNSNSNSYSNINSNNNSNSNSYRNSNSNNNSNSNSYSNINSNNNSNSNSYSNINSNNNSNSNSYRNSSNINSNGSNSFNNIGQLSSSLSNFNSNNNEPMLKDHFSISNKYQQQGEENTLDYLEQVTQNLKETKNIFMGNVLS